MPIDELGMQMGVQKGTQALRSAFELGMPFFVMQDTSHALLCCSVKPQAVETVGVLGDRCRQGPCVEIITSQCSLPPRPSLTLWVIHVPIV